MDRSKFPIVIAGAIVLVLLGTAIVAFQLGAVVKAQEGTPSQQSAEAGMTPMQIIVAATLTAARVSNLANDLGTLEQGKIADVLVVDGDPLSDLEALTEARLVIHEGTVIRNELPSATPPPPRPASGRVGG